MLCPPFHREVPEPQERRTQEGKRQIERDIPALGHVRRGQRQDAVEDRTTSLLMICDLPGRGSPSFCILVFWLCP
jgi:hypothetical protein